LSDVTENEIAERHAELRDARAAELSEQVRRFAQPAGDERALDVGTGVGALAFALAALVREVVAVDVSPERLALARRHAPSNLIVLEGDAIALPFERGSFDLVCTARTLHHVRRPELVVAELVRVTRLGGRLLVIDQLAPVDPLVAIELDRFERARDPSHARLLPDGDMRALFEANGLVVLRDERVLEERDLDEYLDLAGCEGEQRERARTLAPGPAYAIEVGWYLLRR
jgi:ubiquinone/menaquinone biosynthesis C-methylase UbiE